MSTNHYYLCRRVDWIQKLFSRRRSKQEKTVRALIDNGTKNYPEEVTSFARLSKVRPLHIFSEWFEAGTTMHRLTAGILLPSGVGIGALSTCVSECGHFLLLIVTWPNPLVSLHHLHWKLLISKSSDHIEIYHPKLIGFEQFPNNM